VAGYEAWKKNFNRQVKKGEKGIKIFAPVPYKSTIERDKIDPSTRQVVLDRNGEAVKEQVEVRRAAFRAITVFDVSQTTGDPLPLLSPTLLREDVADFENVLAVLIQTAKIPVRFEDIPGEAFGYYDRTNKRIVVREGLAQAQTVKTLIHEIAHSRLHAIDENAPDSDKHLPDQNTREVEALCTYFHNADVLI
jgi:antirestriction protein ArdC